MKVKELYSSNGVKIFNVREDKFKTNTINVFFVDNLTRERVSANALMMTVLKRGTNKYPKTQQLERRKEELYGLSFDCLGYKKGETQVLHFFANIIDDKFTIDDRSLLGETFEFMSDVILDPYIRDNKFDSEYLETGKTNLINAVESKINEKKYYANEKLIENMCEGEAFGIYEFGYVEDYEKMTNEEVVRSYHRMIENLPMYIFVVGSVSDEDVMKYTKCFREIKRGEIVQIKSMPVEKKVERTKTVVEEMDIVQDKYCMGFRTNVRPEGEEYLSLMVYNNILGGSVTSKLFNNIREKNSLCYYIYSTLNRMKGLMIVSTGIDGKNKDVVREMILQEIDNMRKGNITDDEMSVAKKGIQNSLEAIKDTQYGVIDVELTNKLFGYKFSIDDMIAMLDGVTKEDVMKVSKNIMLDTEYSLTTNK